MKKLIVDKDSPVLRQVATRVPLEKIGTSEIDSVLKKMKTALHSQIDGVAIAAPQVGESLRIFIVSGRALRSIATGEKLEEITDETEDIVFINPEITKLSRKKIMMEEGCLSVRWLYGQVKRSEKATVRAYDESGTSFTQGASGLLAQIFQHEVDHLDGILFIDKAEHVENIPPEEYVQES